MSPVSLWYTCSVPDSLSSSFCWPDPRLSFLQQSRGRIPIRPTKKALSTAEVGVQSTSLIVPLIKVVSNRACMDIRQRIMWLWSGLWFKVLFRQDGRCATKVSGKEGLATTLYNLSLWWFKCFNLLLQLAMWPWQPTVREMIQELILQVCEFPG